MPIIAQLVLKDAANADVTFTPANGQPGSFQQYIDRASSTLLGSQDFITLETKFGPRGTRRPAVYGRVYYTETTTNNLRYIAYGSKGFDIPASAPAAARARASALQKSVFGHVGVEQMFKEFDPPRLS